MLNLFLSSPLVANLGIQSGPNAELVLICLKKLAVDGTEDEGRFRQLYLFLDREFEEEFVPCFENDPLIYVPGHHRKLFWRRSEVFWEDASAIFGDSRAYVGNRWKELEHFFLKALEVSRSPSPEDYVAALKQISRRTPIEKKTVWIIYEILETHLSQFLKKSNTGSESWWEDFLRTGLFLTDMGEFRKNADNIFVNDDDEYYAHFKGNPSFAFLELPDNKYPNFRNLISAGKVRMLSEAVEIADVVHEGERLDNCLTDALRRAVPFLERYLNLKDNEAYDRLKRNGEMSKLREIKVFTCDKLEMELRLLGATRHVPTDVAERLFTLFVSSKASDPEDRIGVVLSKRLRLALGVDSFLCLLLAKRTENAMEKLMTAYRIPSIGVVSDPSPGGETQPIDPGPEPIAPQEGDPPRGKIESPPVPPPPTEPRSPRGPELITTAPQGDRKKYESPGKNWYRVRVRSRSGKGVTEQEGSSPTPVHLDDHQARKEVIEYEARRGRTAAEARALQRGYDVISCYPDGRTRKIEVKGLKHRWSDDATITLTRAQFDDGRSEQADGSEYWLYVVDGLATGSPHVYPIRGAAAMAEWFYFQAQDWVDEAVDADFGDCGDNLAGRA